MSDGIIHLAKDTFEDEVARSDRPVLVDFWAPWCGYCRMLSPIIEEIAGENHPFKVCKINADDASDIAARLDVMALPTLIAFKDGKPVAQRVGFCSKADILEMMNGVM